MLSTLSKQILSTVIYYDILDYPLTSFEIWKYLISNGGGIGFKKEEVKLCDISMELDGGGLNGFIEEYRGFYFLRGKKKLVEKRIGNNKISEEKFKIIRKIVFWLRFVPFVRMIAVTGRVAQKNARSQSDLDLLVVLKKGRIFTGRLLVVMVVHMLGKRRHGMRIKNRACLNYFITDGSLEIDLKDIFSAHEYSFAVPVFGAYTFRRFQRSNFWIRAHNPNFAADSALNLKVMEDSVASDFFQIIGEWMLGLEFLEQRMKRWQMKRIAKDPRTYQAGSGVTAGSDSLIFLPEPQGPKIYDLFQKKLGEIGSDLTKFQNPIQLN